MSGSKERDPAVRGACLSRHLRPRGDDSMCNSFQASPYPSFSYPLECCKLKLRLTLSLTIGIALRPLLLSSQLWLPEVVRCARGYRRCRHVAVRLIVSGDQTTCQYLVLNGPRDSKCRQNIITIATPTCIIFSTQNYISILSHTISTPLPQPFLSHQS